MEELILKERETREKMVELINASGLPAIILKPIIKEMYEQISDAEIRQYNQALTNKEENENKKQRKEQIKGKK